jgi:hypothetical protein
MKNLAAILGVILILGGLGTFVYKGFSYTTQEKVLQIGDVQVTAEKEKSVYFPPILGGAAIIVGIVLIIVGRTNRR